MGNDGISAINNSCIITALVEHTHIKTEYVGHVNSTSHTTFIWADDHHVVGIKLQIVHVAEQTLDKLIGRLYCFETMQRNRILHTWIMCIKGDDIINTHMNQLLQCKCTVKGFTGCSLVLAAFVEEGHDHSDPSCLTTDCSNDTLQILIVVIRGHVVFTSAERIGQAVIGNINENIKICTTDRFQDHTLCFTGTKTRYLGFQNVGIALIT